MSVNRGCLVSLLLCLLGAAIALAQPVGPEFRVNTYTTNTQTSQTVASESSGNFVVVWEAFQDDVDGIFGQRYASTGAPLGQEFRVNTSTTFANHPAVASDYSGNFVVVWWGWGLGEIDTADIFGQRFSAIAPVE